MVEDRDTLQTRIWELQSRDVPRYVLTDAMRRYIKHDNPGNQSVETREEQIKTRKENLGTRLQDLFEDIALFYAHSPQSWEHESEKLWEEIIEFEPAVSRVVDEEVTVESNRTTITPCIAFGFELGMAIRLLQPTEELEDNWEELIEGFALALVRGVGDELGWAEVDEQLDKSFRWVRTLSGYQIPDSPFYDPPEDVILEESKASQLEDQRAAIESVLARRGVEWNEVVFKEIQRWVRHAKYPGEITDEDRIAEIIDGLPPLPGSLEEIEALRECLIEDTQVITDREFWKTAHDAYVEEPLRYLWENTPREFSSSALAENTNPSQGGITYSFRKLAGHSGYDQPVTHPVVEGTNSEWSLTKYGELLAYHCFEQDGSAMWLVESAVSAETVGTKKQQRIKAALAELNGDTTK